MPDWCAEARNILQHIAPYWITAPCAAITQQVCMLDPDLFKGADPIRYGLCGTYDWPVGPMTREQACIAADLILGKQGYGPVSCAEMTRHICQEDPTLFMYNHPIRVALCGSGPPPPGTTCGLGQHWDGTRCVTDVPPPAACAGTKIAGMCLTTTEMLLIWGGLLLIMMMKR